MAPFTQGSFLGLRGLRRVIGVMGEVRTQNDKQQQRERVSIIKKLDLPLPLGPELAAASGGNRQAERRKL